MNAELPNPNPGPFAVRPRSEAGGAGGAAAGNQPAHPNVERVGAVQRTAAAALVLAHSQRHLPEQELENQQNLLFQVFADSPNLVYVEDAEGRLVMVNKSYAELLGWLVSRSRPAREAKEPTPTPGPSPAVAAPKQDVTFEESYHLMNGETRLYRTTQCQRQHLNGTHYLITFSSDITDLNRATQQAEESARSKQLFMANMSHEIRTPLHGVMGLTDLLLKGQLSPEQADYLDMIKSSTTGLLVVINDILDFVKIESGNISFEKIPFDVVRTVQEAARSLAYKSEEKGLLLEVVSSDETMPLALGDPYRLRQIMVNLISNAIKFTDYGAVTIRIDAAPPTSTALPVTFSVTDTGLGIREENFERIFGGFLQADSSTPRLYGGTGLGLTICKNLVELQGGTIGLRSEPGHGSCFSFTIPYAACTEAPAKRVADVPSADLLQGLNVLLAEDNAINQLVAVSMLGQWQVNVELAQNGEEALAKARLRQYDLILMDVQMPVMDGLEATARVRAGDGRNTSTPIIALTADIMRVNANTRQELGLTDFLTKPYTELALYRTLARVSKRGDGASLPVVRAVAQDQGLHYDLRMLGHLADDPSFVRKILQMFIDRVPGQVQAMHEAVEQLDWATISREAHALKSTFGTLNIQPEVSNLKKLQELAEAQAPQSKLLPLVVAVANATRLFVALFGEKLAQLPPAEA